MNIFHFKLEESVYLWETDRQIVAMLNPDSPGEAFFKFIPRIIVKSYSVRCWMPQSQSCPIKQRMAERRCLPE